MTDIEAQAYLVMGISFWQQDHRLSLDTLSPGWCYWLDGMWTDMAKQVTKPKKRSK